MGKPIYFLLASFKTLISNFSVYFILFFKRIVKLYFNEKLLIFEVINDILLCILVYNQTIKKTPCFVLFTVLNIKKIELTLIEG